ncbi:MAG: ATP-dependent RNA helicase DeaD [Myxococcota bacterium]|jgi:ATP-dependent RNA helicase DeaD
MPLGAPVSTETEITTFASLGLDERLTHEVAKLGYDTPTPIQEQAIPLMLEGRDVLGLAGTGTGKTAAFALPIIHQMATMKLNGRPVAFALCPTRELAMQVAENFRRYGKPHGIRVLAVYGGSPMHLQTQVLRKGCDVVVGTPGRVLDHLRRKTLDLTDAKFVVMDEADEMLDMGFQEDIESIFENLTGERQTALFSATFPHHLRGMAKRLLNDPIKVEVKRQALEDGEEAQITQKAYLVPKRLKRAALVRVLTLEDPTSTLVFCRTRIEVDEVAADLSQRGYLVEALHGGLSQVQRDRVMQKLRAGRANLVVATDVAARGLDVDHLSHVVNYDIPAAAEQYVHRIGRTGRAGREGTAISFLEPSQRRKVRIFEGITKRAIERCEVPTLKEVGVNRLSELKMQVLSSLTEQSGDYTDLAAELVDEGEATSIIAALLRIVDEASGTIRYIREFDEPRRKGEPRDTQKRTTSETDSDWTRLFVDIGAEAGMRPGDLFGAIVSESGVNRGSVGNIKIRDRFSLVDVQEGAVDDVIHSLRGASWRGRKVTIRRDRGLKKDARRSNND